MDGPWLEVLPAQKELQHCTLTVSPTKFRISCGQKFVESAALHIPTWARSGTPTYLVLGADFIPRPDSDPAKGFHGWMDDVRVWGASRTKAQIRTMLKEELSGSEENLVAYYRMGEETRDHDVLDATGAGRHLEHTSVGHGTERVPEEAITPERFFPTLPAGTPRRLAVPFPGPALSVDGPDRLAAAVADKASAQKPTIAADKTPVTARSCRQLKAEGFDKDGVYEIATSTDDTTAETEKATATVYCAMSKWSGGWTLALSNAGGGDFTATNVAKAGPSMSIHFIRPTQSYTPPPFQHVVGPFQRRLSPTRADRLHTSDREYTNERTNERTNEQT